MIKSRASVMEKTLIDIIIEEEEENHERVAILLK